MTSLSGIVDNWWLVAEESLVIKACVVQGSYIFFCRNSFRSWIHLNSSSLDRFIVHLKYSSFFTCWCVSFCTCFILLMQLQKVESLSSRQYTVAVRIYPDQSHPNESFLDQHVARTCGTISDDSKSSDTEFLKWNEIFFFKVDSLVGTYLFIFN